MKNLNELMEIRLTGSDISPEKIGISELADLLINLEKSMIPVIKRDNPGISIDDSVISLISIEEGSAKYGVNSPLRNIVLPAFVAVIGSIASKQFKDLPFDSLEPLKEISKLTQKRKCEVEFRTNVDSQKSVA